MRLNRKAFESFNGGCKIKGIKPKMGTNIYEEHSSALSKPDPLTLLEVNPASAQL